jgi:hypothetical protein
VIAKQHGATLALSDNNPGLRVAVRFAGSGTSQALADAPAHSQA